MGVQGGGVEVSGADRRQLEGWLRSHSTPQALVTRARIVLGSADGESIRELAERLDITQRTVCLWRRRYREAGLAGLRTLPRSGRPRRISVAKERAVLSATVRKPAAATHWSTRRLAKEVGLSRASVHRIWQKYGLQPHRVETFKFSTDPDFDRKLTDVVGLYLDPPERALVLCVDEKSQIQALNRTQPRLPMWPGLPARRTHDYTRHGTTSLFAALEVASGKVHARCFRRHRHEEFIAFLRSLVHRYPGREIHLICDNYGTHKHPAVMRWLEAHPRIHLHFTPTGTSWLNLVERWFGLITDQAIRRGSFDSVRRLEEAINRWLAHWNQNARPFRWTKSAAQIKRSIRNAELIYETGH
ncbi:MAG: IS630 family transposase [Candidatus Binataceae bacterium]